MPAAHLVPSDPRIPAVPADLSSDWLTACLRAAGVLTSARVVELERETLGEGHGFVGSLARLRLRLDHPEPGAPATLIAKLPIHSSTNRGLGELLNVYEREILFYNELAERVPIRTPRRYYADGDLRRHPPSEPALLEAFDRLPAWLHGLLLRPLLWLARHSRRRYVLLLEDLAGARAGDQLSGCSHADAERALRAVAIAHAAMWRSPDLEARPWLSSLLVLPRFSQAMFRRSRRAFFEANRGRVPASLEAVADWLDAHAPALIERLAAAPATLLHGDYRLDNLFFDAAPGGDPGVTAVDWQATCRGPGVWDAAYFVCGTLDAGRPREEEEALLRAYHAELVASGVTGYGLEACRRDYELSKLLLAHRTISGHGVLDLSDERGGGLLDSVLRRLAARLPTRDLDDLLE